jgi:hypothetical protein
VLASPKPTTFAHYLTQDGRKGKGERTTYLAGDQTTTRGHKLYWHRWNQQGLALIEAENQRQLLDRLRRQDPSEKQHTILRPVRAGVTFTGRVRFDNLTDAELGALLASVRLPAGCAHKLGMGKPLGLGSVRVMSSLHLVDRDRRSRSWADDGALGPDSTAATEQRCTEAFQAAVQAHAHSSGETLLDDRTGLAKVARLDALFTMLRWEPPADAIDGPAPGGPRRPPPAATPYLPEPGLFSERHVLPSPHRVAGQPEPPWPDSPPRPAPRERDLDAESRQRRSTDPVRAHRAAPEAPKRSATRGATVRVRVLEEKTRKGRWLFELPGGQQAVLAPNSPEPPGLAPGMELDLEVVGEPSGAGDKHRLRWAGTGTSPIGRG